MFEQAFKNTDDVLRKDAGWTSELNYTEQTARLLILKYVGTLERDNHPLHIALDKLQTLDTVRIIEGTT